MATLRAELAAKHLPTGDEACVLHAMFPQEFAKLHAPAPTPVAAPAPVGPGSLPATGPKHFFLTIEQQRHEIRVEEITSPS